MAFDWGEIVGPALTAAATIGATALNNNAALSAANTTTQASQQSIAAQERLMRESLGLQERQYLDTVARSGATTAEVTALLRQLYEKSTGQIDTARDQALGITRQAYDNSTAINRPYVTTGASALSRLGGIYGLDTVDASGNVVKGTPGGGIDPNDTFYQSPDYQYQLSQGIKGVDAGAAARGMLDSGATRKAEIKYAGNLASGQFNTYAQRLAQLAGVGQSAASAQNNANANYASGAASAITGAANNQVSANNNFGTSYGNTVMGAADDITKAGTNYANTGTNLNSSYGNNYATLISNAANNNANSQLVQGANNSNLVGTLAGIAGGYFQNNPGLFSATSPKPVTTGVIYNDPSSNPQLNGGYYG